ncbi:MAG TPA: hypothetical protein VK065_05445 [Brevibacterium sp.]|nr:hypothetical protein [Brevibacterium sp.]
MPTWGNDLLRTLMHAAFLQVLFGATILLVRWRLLTSRSGDVIDDTQVWAAVVVLATPLCWVFLQVKRSRPDSGFRRTGLLSLLLAGVAGATCCQLLAVLVWQLLMGPDLIADSVLGAIDEDPLAFVIMLSLVVCVHAAFVVVCVPMVTCGTVGLLVNLVPLIGLLVGGIFAVMWSVRMEPTWGLALGWAAATAAAVSLMVPVAHLATHVRRARPGTGARLDRGEPQGPGGRQGRGAW